MSSPLGLNNHIDFQLKSLSLVILLLIYIRFLLLLQQLSRIDSFFTALRDLSSCFLLFISDFKKKKIQRRIHNHHYRSCVRCKSLNYKGYLRSIVRENNMNEHSPIAVSTAAWGSCNSVWWHRKNIIKVANSNSGAPSGTLLFHNFPTGTKKGK